MYSQALRTVSRSTFRVSTLAAPSIRPMSTTAARMGSTDRSHATGESVASGKAPADEKKLPDSVHPHSQNPGTNNKTHAKGDGAESILPKKVQEMVPESVERAVPNALHNTGDK